jgi:hypothetical protein
MHRPFQAILRFGGLGGHEPPDEVGAPEHCIWKPFTSGKLPKLDCLGIRARRVGAFVTSGELPTVGRLGIRARSVGAFVPGSMGAWKPGCLETLAAVTSTSMRTREE